MTSPRAVPAFALALLACGDRGHSDLDPSADRPVLGLFQRAEDPYARPPGGGSSPVIVMNRGATPPVTERPGEGTTTEAPTATATANGFEIQFPGASPVTTPAVHDGRLIVSGGFNSRAIYAYHATTGRPAWGAALSDDGPSNPVCEGQTCVFNSESCTTFAVDARTGQVRWAWWLGDPQTSAPTLANGLVFASYPFTPSYNGDVTYAEDGSFVMPPSEAPAGATHVLAAFELATGRPVWRRWLDGDVMSSPVAVDDFVYVTTFAGTVMKLDQRTGDIRFAVAMRATSAPVIVRDDNRESVYVTRRVEERADETREALVRADVGQTRLAFRAHPKAAPYLDGDVQRETDYAKLATTDDGENGFSSVPATAGAGIASSMVGVANVSTMQRFQGSRALVAGGLVYSTMGDEVIAVDATTGETKWRHALAGDTRTAGGHLGTAPLIAGGEIVIATLAGEVVRLGAQTGKLVATYRTNAPVRSQPAVQGGWIYLGTEDGRLIAIDTKDRKLTGWPTWGGNTGRTAVR
ncbi:MAG TPA: PQQ-binding-like beta-propeller repeat protein [Kofleriaceae bacterium]